MNWNKKTVLITGAGGFIGSHLTERLVNLGATVKAFVRYNSRNNWGLLELLSKEKLNEIEVILGDLKDSDAIRRITKDVDMIFHLGALIAIPYSYISPRETIETNIMGTFNIMTAAKENQVGKVIHTSTSEVYGTARYVPIDENHPLQGQSPYSASKIGADKITESFFYSYDLPVTIIRPFNTYGPRQSARAIVPTIITQALTQNKIYLGSTYPTRDLTYITDTIRGFIKIAESPKSIGETINIGSNYEISIDELAKKITEMINPKIKIITTTQRIRPKRSEVERLFVDNSKAKKLLNWKPKVNLNNGLKKTIDWISKNIELYKPEMYVV